MILFALKFFIWLNNWSYTMLSSLAVRQEHGLHPKHRIMRYHDFFIRHISADQTLLDIGCGNGALAYDVAQNAKRVIGIDMNIKSVERARARYTRPNITYLVGDATTYLFTEKIDVVILSNVLEHIDDRVLFLKKIKLLAPLLLIRVPLITRDWLSVYKKELGCEYRLDPTHFTEYSEAAFAEEMAAAGLRIRERSVQFGELFAVVETSPL